MQTNIELIKQFDLERSANEIKEKTRELDNLVLRQLSEFIGKRFKEATKEDMISFFNSMQGRYKRGSIHTYKVKVKLFYNWLYKLERRQYPDSVRWIRPTNPRRRRGTKTKGDLPVKPEDILTEKDILKLINEADHPRDQAIVAALYETGAEANELLRMKIGSVTFDKQGAVVTLEGEEGARRLRVVFSVPYLQTWINVHRQRDNPQAPLWLTKQGKARVIGYDNLWFLLKKLRERSKIQKPVSARWIRHARLTHLAKVLPEQKLKKFAGWTPNSGMASVYVHLSGKDLDKDILELYGREVEEKKPVQIILTPIECVRCHAENTPTAKFCSTCGMVLNEEEARRLEHLEEQKIMGLSKKEQETRELRKTLDELQPLIEFSKSFKSSEQFESFLTALKQSMGGKTPTLIVHIDPEFMDEDVAVESLKQLYQRCYDLEKKKRQKKSGGR
jgi:integrase/recombinase XerD